MWDHTLPTGIFSRSLVHLFRNFRNETCMCCIESYARCPVPSNWISVLLICGYPYQKRAGQSRLEKQHSETHVHETCIECPFSHSVAHGQKIRRTSCQQCNSTALSLSLSLSIPPSLSFSLLICFYVYLIYKAWSFRRGMQRSRALRVLLYSLRLLRVFSCCRHSLRFSARFSAS